MSSATPNRIQPGGSATPVSADAPWHQSIKRVPSTSGLGTLQDYSWKEPAPPWFSSIALALFGVAIATAIKISADSLLGEPTPFLLYTGAILAAGWYGGFRAGLAATVLSVTFLEWACLEPRYSLLVSSGSDFIRLGLFLVEGLFISWMMHMLQQGRDDRAYSYVCQQLARDRAERSEQRLRFALEAASMVAWEWDLTTNQVAYSSEAEKVLGLGPDGLSDKALVECVHSDDLPALTQAVKGALDGEAEYRTEFRILRPDGVLLWLQDRGQVIRDLHRRPVRMTGVLLDITHRRLAEEALREGEQALQRSNETLRSVLLAHPDIMFVVDMQGKIRLKNVTGERFLHALNLTTSFPVEIDRVLKLALAGKVDHLPSNIRHVLDFRIDRQDRYYLPRVALIQSKKGSPLGAAVVLQDVTEFRLLDEIKTNIVATVSHEIKTPLTSVQTALQVLLCQNLGKLNPKQEEMVLIARDEAQRLLRTLNSLLDLTRFEEGASGMRFEATGCTELIRDAMEETRMAVANSRIQLSTRIDDALPVLDLDRHRILNVLVNLITNAIKYSPEGSEIIVQASRVSGDQVRFSVIDQGPGVAPEYQGRLFEKFFRVPNVSKNGAGLGLTIAREFVQAHGGTIGIESQPGHGSEFYFILNRTPGPKPPMPDPSLSRTPLTPCAS